MKTIGTLLSAAVVLLAFGCVTNSHREETITVDVTRHRTFALDALPAVGPASDPTAPLRLADTARQAIVQCLTRKGFTEAPADQADFLVQLVGEFAPDPLSEGSERRMITINFIDRVSERQFWSTHRGRSGTQTLSPEQLRATLTSMLESVPTKGDLGGK